MRITDYILSEEIYQSINKGLQDFLVSSNAYMAIIMNFSGHILGNIGFVENADMQTMGALISGVFNSAQEISRVIGEKKGFSSFFQKGKNYTIYYGIVGEGFILSTVFDNSTLLGVIQVAAKELDTYLIKAMEESGKKESQKEELVFSDEDIKKAEESIDNIFDNLF